MESENNNLNENDFSKLSTDFYKHMTVYSIDGHEYKAIDIKMTKIDLDAIILSLGQKKQLVISNQKKAEDIYYLLYIIIKHKYYNESILNKKT